MRNFLSSMMKDSYNFCSREPFFIIVCPQKKKKKWESTFFQKTVLENKWKSFIYFVLIYSIYATANEIRGEMKKAYKIIEKLGFFRLLLVVMRKLSVIKLYIAAKKAISARKLKCQ